LSFAIFGAARAQIPPTAPTVTIPGSADADALMAEFDRGRNAYIYGDYPTVLSALTPLLEPEPLIEDGATRVEAFELLGLAHYYLGQREKARRVFESLVRYRPEHRLNPVLVPPEAVSFYAEEVRRPLMVLIEEERVSVRRQQQEEEERRRKANIVYQETDFVSNSRMVALLPFGIGQFQNDDPIWGGVFLGTEVAAIGLSVGFWAMVNNLSNEAGTYSALDAARARDLRTGQYISGGIAVGLMAVGIAHALFTFEPKQVKVQRQRIGAPPGEDSPERPPGTPERTDGPAQPTGPAPASTTPAATLLHFNF
jgi:tetratricopeptide (TPR) repeat protein